MRRRANDEVVLFELSAQSVTAARIGTFSTLRELAGAQRAGLTTPARTSTRDPGGRSRKWAPHLYNLGVVLVDLGQVKDARPLLERSVRVLEAALGRSIPISPVLARLGPSNADHLAGGAY